MKTHLTLALFFLLCTIERNYCQVPQSIAYQAVARDNSGNPVTNQNISLQFSIREGGATGTIVYQETHNLTTNTLGSFNVNIGEGTVVTGPFASINWGLGTKYLQVEMDIAGGTSFTDMGTQQMISVPFALYSANGNWSQQGNDIYNSNNGNVGVGTTSPANSAKFEINSTTKGFLPPRMTEAQRNAISGPVAGLVIYCSNCCVSGELQLYNGTGWTNITGGAACPVTNVTICSQVWMNKNLDVSTYRNGDPILKVTDQTTWNSLTTGAYCYFNNDSTTYASVYGKLYNWYAVNDPRGLAPVGWHIPSETEWDNLKNCLGGSAVAGGALKETGTLHWNSPNTGATNSSGFTGLPGGIRSTTYQNIGTMGFWWTATVNDAFNAKYNSVSNNSITCPSGVNVKQSGYSVRCIKD